MRYWEIINEAAYDSIVDAIKRQFPDQNQYIQDHVRWAKTTLKNSDNIIWYLRLLYADMENDITPKLLGTYRWQGIQQLGTDISHFYGYNYTPIENYRFGKNTVSDVINTLTNFESEWQAKQEKEKGVTPQKGDYRLLEFNDGYVWWYVNRAYCPEEGRSGRHCGNEAGKYEKKHRILSFRNSSNQVLLTFILEPDGMLGEMKARNNQKPMPKYHPYIIKLLELPLIKGIADNHGQYNPSMNFSMFDLNEQQLIYFIKTKPELLISQLETSPIDILKAPESIKNNPQLQNIAISKRPGLQNLLITKPSITSWKQAVESSPELIIHAPHDISGFEAKLFEYLQYSTGEKLVSAPPSISRNFDLLKKIIQIGDSSTIGGISPNIKGYAVLCEIALNKSAIAIQYIPEESLTESMCLVAVNRAPHTLMYIPEQCKTKTVCLAAFSHNVRMLSYIPEKFQTESMYLEAINEYPDALSFTPEKFITKSLCLKAVSREGIALRYVPEKFQTESICLAAISNDWHALSFITKKMQTEAMYIAAIAVSPYALLAIPEESRTESMYISVISRDWFILSRIPRKLRTEAMYIAALTASPDAWALIPQKLRSKIKSQVKR